VKKVLVIIAVIALAGCATFKVASSPNKDYKAATALVKDKKYQEAVTIFKNIIVQSPRSDIAADSLFQIAYVQTLYDNPHKDYAKALQSLDEFVKRYPKHAKLQDAENWRFILRTILGLRKENERLHDNIEQLEKLDIRREEKRKGDS
jgi:outer membrane protein assembly factor BamD (BamD/ComL family)